MIGIWLSGRVVTTTSAFSWSKISIAGDGDAAVDADADAMGEMEGLDDGRRDSRRL